MKKSLKNYEENVDCPILRTRNSHCCGAACKEQRDGYERPKSPTQFRKTQGWHGFFRLKSKVRRLLTDWQKTGSSEEKSETSDCH